MHVRFCVHRQLKVNHNGKLLNMNAASEQIGGNQHLG
ncbi:Uncharacterised protein [Vibrio cholerae]|nr:Uncharacterised protein [Vibrio cholerae]